MSAKKTLIEAINDVKHIITASELIDNSKSKIFEKIAYDIENFNIYLPLIGNFNAGKSSILNTLLEDETLLATDIIPQTAIATEIIYAANERVEAYGFDDDKVIETFSQLEDVKDEQIEHYGYLKVYKNLPFLAENREIIFVDMPGLDSNINRHNSQILNYTQKDGIEFIIVIDIDDGGVKDSTLRFIEEIHSYKLNFFVIINKIDKKPATEVEEIKNSIKNQLLKYSDEPYIGTVTTFDENIDDFKQILPKINKNNYLKSTFVHKIITNITVITQNLKIRKNAIRMDTEEIDKKIAQFQEGVYQFEKSLRKEKHNLKNKFSGNITQEILHEIQHSLEQNIDRLIISIQTSEDSFKLTINEIIRPIVIQSIHKYTEQAFKIVINNLEISSNDIFAEVSDMIGKSKSAIDTMTDLIESTPLLLKIPALVTLLRLISTKISPLIAVISTIVGIVSTFFGKSKEEQAIKARDKIRKNIRTKAIPNIILELEPTIRSTLLEVKEDFFIEIEKAINKQKNELITSLEQAKKEKEKYKDKIKNKRNNFESPIKQLEIYKKQLENL